MDSYIIELMGGGTIKITPKEVGDIRGKTGLVHISRLDRDINISSIKQILPESDYKNDKIDENIGVLHDGQRVVRKFGVWYVDDGSFEIRIDPSYYPEVAKDNVLSVSEYEKIKHLPIEERLKLVSGEDREGGGLKKIEPKKYD